MIICYARVSTTEQNLGSQQDDVSLAFEASVLIDRRAEVFGHPAAIRMRFVRK